MARLIATALMILLVLVACGDSDEEKLFKSIYYSNVDSRTTEQLRSEGLSPATDREYDLICEMWYHADYRPNDYEDMALAVFIWRDDTGASEREGERIGSVWIALDAVTSVLKRELDTIYNAKDFCEFKHR